MLRHYTVYVLDLLQLSLCVFTIKYNYRKNIICQNTDGWSRVSSKVGVNTNILNYIKSHYSTSTNTLSKKSCLCSGVLLLNNTLKQIYSILLNVNDSKLYRVRENLASDGYTLTVIVLFEDRVGFLNGNNTKSQYYENPKYVTGLICLINDIFPMDYGYDCQVTIWPSKYKGNRSSFVW